MLIPSFFYYSCVSTTFLTSRSVTAISYGRRGIYHHSKFFCSSTLYNRHSPIPVVCLRHKLDCWSSTSSSSIRRYSTHDPTPIDGSTNNFNTSSAPEQLLLLPFKEERHKSIHIHVTEDVGRTDTSLFVSQLLSTVEVAKAMGKSSVWIHVPMNRASLIEAISTCSKSYPFQFHHAQGTVASLYLWLPQHINCTIPPFATHHVVRNDNEKQIIYCVGVCKYLFHFLFFLVCLLGFVFVSTFKRE